MKTKAMLAGAMLAAMPVLLEAQFEFKIEDKDVQIHSFATQAFMYSNDNNYLSTETSKGTFDFTDAGANISSQITDKFRVGAQVYLRNLGKFGLWKPQLDWAYGAYQFKPWFGIKAGKVKTVLGLFNDVQDIDTLHTFALLPEGVYPIDWRSTTIAHTGGDVYGDIAIKHLGVFSYTGYAGLQPQDLHAGYDLAFAPQVIFNYRGGPEEGGDLRWRIPFGAVVGISYLNLDITGRGSFNFGNGVTGPYHQNTVLNSVAQEYGQYSYKNFQVEGEYRKNLRDTNLHYGTIYPDYPTAYDSRSWYVAATYHLSQRYEIGAYRSIYYVDTRKPTALATDHEFDTTLSWRVNFTNHWYAKLEGHIIDGTPTSPSAARGFYLLSNPQGLQPRTDLLVIRTGVAF